MHACETSSKNSLHVQKLITVGFFREAPPISLLGSAFQWMLQGCSPETYKMLPLFFWETFFSIQQFFSEWKFLTTVMYFPVSTLIYTRVIAVNLLRNKTTGRPSSPPTHHPSAPVPASLFSRQCPALARQDPHYLYGKGTGCHLPAHSACINCACLLFIVTQHILCFCVTCH